MRERTCEHIKKTLLRFINVGRHDDTIRARPHDLKRENSSGFQFIVTHASPHAGQTLSRTLVGLDAEAVDAIGSGDGELRLITRVARHRRPAGQIDRPLGIAQRPWNLRGFWLWWWWCVCKHVCLCVYERGVRVCVQTCATMCAFAFCGRTTRTGEQPNLRRVSESPNQAKEPTNTRPPHLLKVVEGGLVENKEPPLPRVALVALEQPALVRHVIGKARRLLPPKENGGLEV